VKSAMIVATAYFIVLFALGFVLGTIRVLIVAPRFGELVATVAEVPVMLTAAYFICRWALWSWHVPRSPAIRWAMVPLFPLLLFLFETLLGTILFGRTASDQWASLATPAGLLGLSAQVVAALLPVFVGMDERLSYR
jgi:hypothetical protein